MTATDTGAGATVDQVAEKVMMGAVGTADLLAIYLGDRLGWYTSLRDHGASTAGELARRTGTDPRYAREWLEAQAVSGLLAASPGGPDERRYELTPASREVLTDATSLAYLTPLARLMGAAAQQLPALVDAYRTGDGVSWARFGADARTGQADMNRPWFERVLAGALAGVPSLDRALRGIDVRIADVGCGEGWSTVALARAYPDARVDGVDIDAPSTAAAAANVDAAGLDGRVTVATGDAASLLGCDTYDAVFAFECLHDLPRPVEMLGAMRRSLRAGGRVVVMDEAAAAEFSPPGDPVERLLYGFSTLICLPDAMSHRPTAATGTVIRVSTVERYAREAGFTRVEVLPIEDFGFWRFYQLTEG